MRLSEWRASSPNKEAASAKVAAVVDPILVALGAGKDPECWVAWGEEPSVRYAVYAPMAAGLITCFVRVNVSGEGPRASAKLVRWSRVQLGELAIETQGSHRLLSFQVEQQVLNGADEKADQVAAFALGLMAAIDGRPAPVRAPTGKSSASKPAAGAKTRTMAARGGGAALPAPGKRPAGSNR